VVGRLALLGLWLWAGCGTSVLVLRGAPAQPFDAVIVPGCPSEADGALSRCQMGRVLWAAIVWERGWARTVIVSGAAVHSPYVEAEALAAGLAALGVPADKILIEPDALHTDENMYHSLRVARAFGLRTIAVASSRGHAAWGCRMMLDWGQPCTALAMDESLLPERHARSGGALERIRSRRVAHFVPLAERERQIAARTGRHRPPSFLLYPHLGWLRINGQRWIPSGPARPPRTTWAELEEERAGTP